MSEKVIECLEDYKNIFNNFKYFFLDQSSLNDINLNFNKMIPKFPCEKLIPRFNENASMETIPSGFNNRKKLNALYKSEPISIQLQENKNSGSKIWELKYADGNKAIINHNPKRGDNIIIKKINENDNFCYYDETFKQVSEEIKIRNANTKEVLILSKDLNLAEIKELSLLINGLPLSIYLEEQMVII